MYAGCYGHALHFQFGVTSFHCLLVLSKPNLQCPLCFHNIGVSAALARHFVHKSFSHNYVFSLDLTKTLVEVCTIAIYVATVLYAMLYLSILYTDNVNMVISVRMVCMFVCLLLWLCSTKSAVLELRRSQL